MEGELVKRINALSCLSLSATSSQAHGDVALNICLTSKPFSILAIRNEFELPSTIRWLVTIQGVNDRKDPYLLQSR